MNKFRVIRLAAYFLAVLFGGLLLYYLFSLGANLHLSKAATKEVDKQIGNLLTLQAEKIDSLKIENKEGSIYLLNKGSTLNVSAKRQFSIKNDKKNSSSFGRYRCSQSRCYLAAVATEH